GQRDRTPDNEKKGRKDGIGKPKPVFAFRGMLQPVGNMGIEYQVVDKDHEEHRDRPKSVDGGETPADTLRSRTPAPRYRHFGHKFLPPGRNCCIQESQSIILLVYPYSLSNHAISFTCLPTTDVRLPSTTHECVFPLMSSDTSGSSVYSSIPLYSACPALLNSEFISRTVDAVVS